MVDREVLAVERPVLGPFTSVTLTSLAAADAPGTWPPAMPANVEPTTGMSPRNRSRNGTALMWSSWPWVRITASTSSIRSSMYRKSGRIRSTPGCASRGTTRRSRRSADRRRIRRRSCCGRPRRYCRVRRPSNPPLRSLGGGPIRSGAVWVVCDSATAFVFAAGCLPAGTGASVSWRAWAAPEALSATVAGLAGLHVVRRRADAGLGSSSVQ